MQVRPRTTALFLIFLFCLSAGHAQTFEWVKQLGGTGGEAGRSIAVDVSGNVYLLGEFNATIDFDPGASVFNLTPAGGYDVYVSKLDAAGNFVWAKQLGGTSNELGISIATDAFGNVYSVGRFQGTGDFDPGAGAFNLTSAGGNDIFVSKLDAAGNFAWVRQFGGTSHDYGEAIATDASGNVYTTGAFEGTVDFDPGAGIFNLSSPGSTDVFVSKLDAAGNFVWTKQMGGLGDVQVGNYIATDASGNVYTTGVLEGTADFDPGAGTFNLTSAGGDDIFVSKLDALGNFIWARRMGGAADQTSIFINTDISGNVYTTGWFQGTADFNPGAGTFNLTSAGSYDAFVSKLDAAGNFVWAKRMGGTTLDIVLSLATDASSNVYLTGYFQGTVDMDPGVGTFNFTSGGTRDMFISKLDDPGNFVWAKQVGGSGFDAASSIAMDGFGNIYTTGSFQTTPDFDPDAGVFNLSSFGDYDIFVHKLSHSTIMEEDGMLLGGVHEDGQNKLVLALDKPLEGSIYHVEQSSNGQDYVDLGAMHAGEFTNTEFVFTDHLPEGPLNYYKIRVAEMNGNNRYSNVLMLHQLADVGCAVYPNPASDHLSIQFNAKADVIRILVADMLGKTILEFPGSTSDMFTIPVNQLQPGMYFIHLATPEKTYVKPFSKE